MLWGRDLLTVKNYLSYFTWSLRRTTNILDHDLVYYHAKLYVHTLHAHTVDLITQD